MLQILLLIFVLCSSTRSYLNYSGVLPLNSYRNGDSLSQLEKSPIHSNLLGGINAASPFRGQNGQLQNIRSLYGNGNMALYSYPHGRVSNLNSHINGKNVNPLWNEKFSARPLYNQGYRNYGCTNCCHCCHFCRKLPYGLLYPQYPLIVQRPKSSSSKEPPTASSTSSTTASATSFSELDSSTTTTPSTIIAPSTTTISSTTTILSTTTTPSTSTTQSASTTPLASETESATTTSSTSTSTTTTTPFASTPPSSTTQSNTAGETEVSGSSDT